MSPFRTPKQRLPDHLKHLSKDSAGQRGTRAASDRPARVVPQLPEEPAVTAGSERLRELLPLVLRSMVSDLAERSPEGRPVIVGQPEIFAALAPYHRPKSRFEGLMVRKLVGEGYLKPRGARDKAGFSDTYELTPKGESLLDLRRSR